MEINWLGINRINYLNQLIQRILMKKLILFAIIFLVTVQIAFAQDFTISTDIKDVYLAGKSDTLTLTINNQGNTDWFTISVLGEDDWVVEENPLAQINVGESKTINIIVNPPKGTDSMIKGYYLTIARVSTGESLPTQTLLINIRQPGPAIIKDLKLNCEFCEVSELFVSGTVKNTGNTSRNITLRLDALPGIGSETILIGELPIRGIKDFTDSFLIGDLKSGEYWIYGYLTDETGELYNESIKFTIPVIRNVIYNKSVSSTPFGNFVTLTAENKGNTIADAEMTSEISKEWYSIYSGSTPSRKNGDYIWGVRLNPKESKIINYTEIFWPTYMFIGILLIIAFYGYYQLTALTLTKKVGRKTVVRGKPITVSLHVKNRRRDMGNVIVRDLIPENFDVVSKFRTVKPIIRKVGRGTELVWRIGKVNPHEERIIDYVVKPKIDLVGKLQLPSAGISARYKQRPISRKSNIIVLHSKGLEKDFIPVKIE